MKERIVRLRFPEILYRQYKMLCVEKDLSMTKQTIELIKRYLEALGKRELEK